MAKLTTLEGDFDFYGSEDLGLINNPSFLQPPKTWFEADEVKAIPFPRSDVIMMGADEVMVNGPLSFIKRKARQTKNVVKGVVNVAVRNPLTTAALTGGVSLVPQMMTQKGRSNLIGKKSVIQKAGGVALRNPLTMAALTGGASLIPTLMTGTGRSALLGKKSVIKQTGRFIERHPYAFAIPTGGASIAANLFSKKGRQALAGKKPGYRTAPGLTGPDKVEILKLKNKGNLTPQEQARLAELQAKAKAKLAADKANAEAEKSRVASGDGSGSTGGSTGGGGGGGPSGGGAVDTPPTDETAPSPMGGILLAAGIGALMLL